MMNADMVAQSVKDGMHNMVVARKNNNTKVYESLNEFDNKILRDKLKSLGAPDDAKGAVYDVDSSESKKNCKCS